MDHDLALIEVGEEENDVLNEDSEPSYEDSEYTESVEEFEKDTRSNKLEREQGTGNLSRTPSRESHLLPELKKRKTTLEEAIKLKGSRLSGLYSNEYRKLLNADIEDATLQILAEENSPFFESQIGLTIWTPTEKQMFFTALGRLGKDNIEGISSRIETKSILEVREYIKLLHVGMIEHSLKDPRYGLAGLSNFPASMHISQECEDELQKAADALSFRQERYEVGIAERKWSSVPWLLNSKANIWVEKCLTDENGIKKLRHDLPSAELLHLGNFLELSSRIFMNPAPPLADQNWQFLIEADDEEPAIRTTAFEDFHNLVCSVTKRLVSATLFCTMSRLRATDTNGFHASPTVRATDVEAAAKIIGLALNSDEFWARCPKRCHLNVYRRKHDPAPVNPKELKLILEGNNSTTSPEVDITNISECSESSVSSLKSFNLNISDSDPLEDSSPNFNATPEQTRNLASEYLSLITPSISRNTSTAIDPSDSEFSTSSKTLDREAKRRRLKEAAEISQHKYAELLDMRTSLNEEQRLWTDVLRREPPFKIEVEDMPLPEEEPAVDRKEDDELDDWREGLEYQSFWEGVQKLPKGDVALRKKPATKKRARSLRRSRNASSEEDGNDREKRQESDGSS